MGKQKIENAGIIRIAIQQEIARCKELRYGHRLHGLLLTATNQSA